ncbi:hypothetical protein [Maridesulfovibrio sp.]|uniref:hypothetical protein n=1 Tax=Maridesulfovibrio sp. TaxID=2795000 RepID=UPI003AFFC609
MTRPARQRIAGYNYEIDEQGQLFSTVDYPGYGIGYQLKPLRAFKDCRPSYKLRRKGETITLRVDFLVDQYFEVLTNFDSKWYWRTRKAAEIHNEELRFAFLKAKGERQGQPKPQKNEPGPIKPKYNHIPWVDDFELQECARMDEDYSVAIGGDARDASMCPFRY